MGPEFHQRVRQIFDQALERPEAERIAFVETASGGDIAVSDEVERLLRARNEADSFLDATVGHTAQIGRYLIRGELGRGAMGIVYDAIDPMIGRRVAVKVISLQARMDPSEAEFMKERLFREARSAGRLFHPGIVVILDVGLHEDAAFITMEHVDGPSLQQLLGAGRLDSKAALGILQQTAAALDYAHQHGVVHRDIKPANIMLQDKVTVKVADFGIAKLMSSQNTLTGLLMGTPSYMSPEQIEARPVDGRSDQFALAVLAYELLTGVRPFQADSMPTVAHLIVYGPRPSAQAANPSLPPGVDEVLNKALSRLPEQRFQNCTEFAGALQTVFLNKPAVDANPVQQNGKKRALTLGAVAAVVICALVFASLYYRNPAPQRVSNTQTASKPETQAPARSIAPVLQPAPVDKPTPLGEPQTNAPPTKPVDPKIALSIAHQTVDAKQDAKAAVVSKPVPAAFRAQEFYNAALAKRREGKAEDSIGLFRQSADLGDATAMKELGESYNTGEGVAKDSLEAVRWFLRSAAAGNSDAMLALGGLYLLGDEGVPQSDEDALHWFQKAADLSNPHGMYNLARMYEKGQGVSRNIDKAKQLYQESAGLGNVEAQRRLAELRARK
jgi:serine/threonine protein kinase